MEIGKMVRYRYRTPITHFQATWLSYGMKDMLTSTKDFKYLEASLAANSLNKWSGKAENKNKKELK